MQTKIKRDTFKKQVQSIEFAKLLDLFASILSREGYKSIRKEKEYIITSLTAGIQPTRSAFLLYNKVLSGADVDIDSIKDLIKHINEEEKVDAITIVPLQSVSNNVENELKNISSIIKLLTFDELEKLIEKHYPNYVLYESFDLIEYERFFLEEMTEKPALLNIQGLETRVKKLLSIYINPQLFELKKDFESETFKLEKVGAEVLVKKKNSAIIEGDTGSGKSTLLKELGRQIIKVQDVEKTLPIYLSPYKVKENNYDVQLACENLLEGKVPGNWQEIQSNYKIVILLDSIDEFEDEIRNSIISQLQNFPSSRVRYILTTRSMETNNLNVISKQADLFRIRKFNDKQIKEFANRFFGNQQLSDNLIEALTDNRILQRLPLTPLSMSLISLVYEKGNFEIPATISDIYDNFNQLILGKTTANERFELIKFNFRERILSVYALKLLQSSTSQPLNRKEFIIYFVEYFKSKSSDVEDDVLEEFLEYFVSNSGVLIIEQDCYVKFSHNSFLHYYASLEIFKHQRNLEDKLVENFLDLDWQNVSIFYGGQSKDMPTFLENIIRRISRAETIEEYSNSIMGIGYLLQALYQTDNRLREKAVHTVLEHHVNLHDWYKKISSDNQIPFFRNMRLPTVSIFSMYFFYLNFLSSTLTQPMGMAFDSLFEQYKNDRNSTTGYKLLTLAAIFHSQRLKDSSYLEKMINDTYLLSDVYLTTVAEFALYFDSSGTHQELKKKIQKAFDKKKDITSLLRSFPVSKLRFSNFDVIGTSKKYLLVTEGETDAEIIEHAYTVLTGDKIPYWNIRPAGFKGGGANELKFILDKVYPTVNDDESIIGIFDSDASGINNFKGLDKDIYTFWNDYLRVKKHIKSNIFAIKLPIPNSRKQYYKPNEIEMNFFAIEHYFQDELLNDFNMLKETSINGVHKINDGKGAKKTFAKHIKSLRTPSVFKNFIPLFETIDKIFDVQTDYYNLLD